MTIYTTTKRATNKHRKIYEQHYGPIPVDDEGRTYEIHHKDGNHGNNDPLNLVAVTIQEHFDIHFAQGDYGACFYILTQRMDKSPEEISAMMSEIATRSNTKRWENREWALRQAMKNSEVMRREESVERSRQLMNSQNSDPKFIKSSRNGKKKWTTDANENRKHRERARLGASVRVKPVIVDGVEYKNAQEVSKIFAISVPTVRQRIRSNSIQFAGWEYKQNVEVFTVMIDGQQYKDVKTAAEKLGLSRVTIRGRLKNTLFSEWHWISTAR